MLSRYTKNLWYGAGVKVNVNFGNFTNSCVAHWLCFISTVRRPEILWISIKINISVRLKRGVQGFATALSLCIVSFLSIVLATLMAESMRFLMCRVKYFDWYWELDPICSMARAKDTTQLACLGLTTAIYDYKVRKFVIIANSRIAQDHDSSSLFQINIGSYLPI